jgi:hypothetical protein
MTVRIGSYVFPHVRYDAGADVLYLTVDERRGVGEDTPEGHAFFYPDDVSDEVIGAILVRPRAQIDRDGEFTITLPNGEVVAAEDVADAVGLTPG